MIEALRKLNPTPLAPEEGQRILDRFTAAAIRAKEYHVEMPLTHRFTPGLYVREIFMPAGTIVVSRIHKTQHPFVISKGDCEVWSPGTGWQRLRAPHTGITLPGTQRLLLIHEDTIWTTFHPGPWTADYDPQQIVEMVSTAPQMQDFEGLNESVLDVLRNYLPAIEGGKTT